MRKPKPKKSLPKTAPKQRRKAETSKRSSAPKTATPAVKAEPEDAGSAAVKAAGTNSLFTWGMETWCVFEQLPVNVPSEMAESNDPNSVAKLPEVHEFLRQHVAQEHHRSPEEWLRLSSLTLEEAVSISMGLEPYPDPLFEIDLDHAKVELKPWARPPHAPDLGDWVLRELKHRFDFLLRKAKAGTLTIDPYSQHVKLWPVIASLGDAGFPLWKPLVLTLTYLRYLMPGFPACRPLLPEEVPDIFKLSKSARKIWNYLSECNSRRVYEDFVHDLQMARQTVAKALAELEGRGLVERLSDGGVIRSNTILGG